MASRFSYFQRLAAPLGTGQALYPLAQAAPGPSVMQPGSSAPTPEPAAPATTIRRKEVPSAPQRAAARHSKVAIPVRQPEKAMAAVAAMPETAAQPATEALEPEFFVPVPPEKFSAAVTAMPVAEPAANRSEFKPEIARAAAPQLLFPARPELIWGEPIALSQKSAAASPFEPPPPTQPVPERQNGGAKIHIGTIEVRTGAAAPKAPMPPAPAPRAALPPAALPFSRAYGWRFGLSQR
jgi:hypothetical protein